MIDSTIQFQALIATAGLGRNTELFTLRQGLCVGILCRDDELGEVMFRLLNAADFLRDRAHRGEMMAIVESGKTIRLERNRVHLYWPALLIT